MVLLLRLCWSLSKVCEVLNQAREAFSFSLFLELFSTRFFITFPREFLKVARTYSPTFPPGFLLHGPLVPALPQWLPPTNGH